MPKVLDFFRAEDPRFKDVPDDTLTMFVGSQMPEFLQDAEFKSAFESTTGKLGEQGHNAAMDAINSLVGVISNPAAGEASAGARDTTERAKKRVQYANEKIALQNERTWGEAAEKLADVASRIGYTIASAGAIADPTGAVRGQMQAQGTPAPHTEALISKEKVSELAGDVGEFAGDVVRGMGGGKLLGPLPQPVEQVGQGAIDATAGFISTFSDPTMLAQLSAAKVIPREVARMFQAQMVAGFPQAVEALAQSGDLRTATEAALNVAGAAGFPMLIEKHLQPKYPKVPDVPGSALSLKRGAAPEAEIGIQKATPQEAQMSADQMTREATATPVIDPVVQAAIQKVESTAPLTAQVLREQIAPPSAAKSVDKTQGAVDSPAAQPASEMRAAENVTEIPSFAARYDSETLLSRPAWVKPGSALDKALGAVRENPDLGRDITPAWNALTPEQRQDLIARGWTVSNTRIPNQVALGVASDAMAARKYFSAQMQKQLREATPVDKPAEPAITPVADRPSAAPVDTSSALLRGEKVELTAEGSADKTSVGQTANAKGDWETLLELKTALENESKRRAMVFQHDAKQEAAALLGLPQDSLLKLNFDRWSDLSRKLSEFKDEAEAAFSGDSKTTLGKIWSDYAKSNPEKIKSIQDWLKETPQSEPPTTPKPETAVEQTAVEASPQKQDERLQPKNKQEAVESVVGRAGSGYYDSTERRWVHPKRESIEEAVKVAKDFGVKIEHKTPEDSTFAESWRIFDDEGRQAIIFRDPDGRTTYFGFKETPKFEPTKGPNETQKAQEQEVLKEKVEQVYGGGEILGQSEWSELYGKRRKSQPSGIKLRPDGRPVNPDRSRAILAKKSGKIQAENETAWRTYVRQQLELGKPIRNEYLQSWMRLEGESAAKDLAQKYGYDTSSKPWRGSEDPSEILSPSKPTPSVTPEVAPAGEKARKGARKKDASKPDILREVEDLYSNPDPTQQAYDALVAKLSPEQQKQYADALGSIKRKIEKATDIPERNKRMEQPDTGVDLGHPPEESLTLKEPTTPPTKPTPASESSPASEIVEPWQMTRDEYLEKAARAFEQMAKDPVGKNIDGSPIRDPFAQKKHVQSLLKSAEETRGGKNDTENYMHKALVQKALEKGKPVPPEVLADYPDLAPKSSEIVGMGGAVKSEFQSSTTPTSNKNAVVDRERVARGEAPIMTRLRKEWGSVWEEGMARIDRDTSEADRLIKELTANPRPITDVENVILLQRRADLRNELSKAGREASQAYDDAQLYPDRIEAFREAQARAQFFSDELLKLEEATKHGGSETGRALAARKMMMNDDFTLASLEMQKRADNGFRSLTPEERLQLEKVAEEYRLRSEALEKKLNELTAQAEAKEAQAILDRATKEARIEDRYHPKVLEFAEDYAKKWDERGAKALAELKQMLSGEGMALSGPLNPEVFDRLVIYGVSKAVRGAVEAAKWTDAMVKDLGEGFRKHADTVWTAVQQKLETDIDAAKKSHGQFAGDVKKVIKGGKAKPQNIQEFADQAVGRIRKAKDDAAKDKKKLDLGYHANRLAAEFVKSGVKDREKLIDSVWGVLQRALPDVTRRETMDALSGYGQYTRLDPTPYKAILRDLRQQMQQIAKLEDMSAGQSPKRTGQERQLLSDEGRRLTKQVEEAKLKGGYTQTDPATQLRTPLQEVQRRLENQIADLEHQIKTGERIVKEKRSSPTNAKIEALKAQRDALKEQFDAIFNPPLTDAQRLALWKERTQEKIKEYEQRVRLGDYKPKPKPNPVLLDNEALHLRFKLYEVHKAWMEGRMKDQLAQQNPAQKTIRYIGESLNAVRAILTSFDLSAVLRQGGFMALSRPLTAAKSFVPMLRAFASEKAQFAVMEEIRTRPNAPLYDQAKLYLAEHGVRLSQMEEAYMSRWAEHIPGVKASQRAYTTFLNKLRADSFDALVASLTPNGKPTLAEAELITNFVNVATGRGSVAFNKAAVGLNTVFFAPRYVASRFQLLTGTPIWLGKAQYRGTGAVRTLIAKEYARALTGAATVFGLALAAGAVVESDPRSSDFGKIRIGDTRIDPLFGLAQTTTLIGREVSGETKSLNGKITPIRGDVPYGKPDAWDILARFARTKLAPVPGMAVDVFTGKDVVGNPVEPLPDFANKPALEAYTDSMIGKATVPITLRDIYDTMKAQGVPAGTALAILSMFGVGVQTYSPRQKSEKGNQPRGPRGAQSYTSAN